MWTLMFDTFSLFFELAKESIRHATILSSDEWFYWWDLSTVSLALDDYEGALESMEKVLELDPENERAKEIASSFRKAIDGGYRFNN